LANLLQSSKSTFSWENFLGFFAFPEGMLGTPISALEGWPTVSHRFMRLTNPLVINLCLMVCQVEGLRLKLRVLADFSRSYGILRPIMAGSPEQRRRQQQPQPNEAGVSRRKFLGIEWNIRKFRKMQSQEPQSPTQEQGGESHPETTRRGFVRGALIAGAGLIAFAGAGIDKIIGSRTKEEQHVRAYKDVKKKGTPPEPDQQAVANAQQLRATLDPLHESTPQLEVAKKQASETLQQNQVFTQALQQRENDLRAKEGPSDTRETIDDIVAFTGLVTTTSGFLMMAKDRAEELATQQEQALRKRYPSLYPSPRVLPPENHE
jgi:hypothetical protein